MRQIKLFAIGIALVTLMPAMLENGYARGERSGGWSGGRGGGGEHRGNENYNRGGGEYRHEGDRHGDDRHWHDGRYYENGYWGWGYGAADAAIAGVAMSEAVQPAAVVVEQAPAAADQSSNNVDQSPNPTDQQSASAALPYGTQVAALPPGSVSQNVNGIVAYQCGNVWYRPFFGSSGVYYEVVPSPFTGN